MELYLLGLAIGVALALLLWPRPDTPPDNGGHDGYMWGG